MMSKVFNLAPGMRVLCRDAEWLVTRVNPSDRARQHFAVSCVGTDDLVRGHLSMFLTQLDDIVPVDPRETQLVADSSAGFKMARLFLEAQLRQMPVTANEPDLLGMGAFKPMEYQKLAVKKALQQLRPRLLLADAVGLGKTIEAGMILTELIRRGRANRILVLTKKSMLTQFQAELWNRFTIPLVRLDSTGIAKLRLRIPANKNPFEVYHRIIISIDTLKDVGRYRHFLEETEWDVVIIDEAHNVAGASVPERHLSHRLAKLLSRKTRSMLLTTATPHNGKRETFGRLISLLDPSAIPDPTLKEYGPDDIKNFLVMRFKEDVREEAGDNFPQREVIPLAHTTRNATDKEEAAYEVLAKIRTRVKTDKGKGDRLIEYGLYKLFLSSPEACHATVQGRIKRLQEKTPGSSELPILKELKKSVAGLSLSECTRYQILKDQLKEIGWNGKDDSPRVLIFTEYRKTQDALAAALAKDFKLKCSLKFEDQVKQKIGVIHGSFPDIHLMATVESFGTGKSPMRMMIATDVASEGINLHHQCHNIIHFDLPWSIITLIQRNGRIDRFGQTETPHLRYLVVNTKQGTLKGDREIFERLVDKVEVINKSTRSGESVLKLYDPEAEESYIAQKGILKGDKDVLEIEVKGSESEEANGLEFDLRKASVEGLDDLEDLAKFLVGDAPADYDKETPSDNAPASRLRLYGDKDFLMEGYRYLASVESDYPEIKITKKMMIISPPKDLKRRLGKRVEKDDIIFGATAIPDEAWPENDQFQMSDDAAHVDEAIRAAQNTAGQWTSVQLCTEQHPILRWVAERLVMQVKRGQAPHITSKHLKPCELCFCFIGQLSSQAGSPLIVDAHAISFHKGGKFEQRPLCDALEDAKFQDLVNPGTKRSTEAAQGLIPSAVEESLNYMWQAKERREKQVFPLLRKEERRLRKWRQKRHALLEQKLDELSDNHPRARQIHGIIEEMESYIKDREENWRETHLLAAEAPSTQLVLVIEGVK